MRDNQVELNNDYENLLAEIYSLYGYDFKGYSKASIYRRIERFLNNNNLEDIAQLKKFIIPNEFQLELFIQDLTVNVTEMFRDPEFFLSLRKNVLPILSTYPYIKIWVAGCSTGEEIISLAIILEEEKILHKSIIYATDINQKVLKKASTGIYPISIIKECTKKYYKSGGSEEFSKYYTCNYGNIKFTSTLLENCVFYPHNLATDNSFNEFHLILCRNVLIYFDKELQDRVFRLFQNSLVSLGYLGLGKKESIYLSSVKESFEVIDRENKIHRKTI